MIKNILLALFTSARLGDPELAEAHLSEAPLRRLFPVMGPHDYGYPMMHADEAYHNKAKAHYIVSHIPSPNYLLGREEFEKAAFVQHQDFKAAATKEKENQMAVYARAHKKDQKRAEEVRLLKERERVQADAQNTIHDHEKRNERDAAAEALTKQINDVKEKRAKDQAKMDEALRIAEEAMFSETAATELLAAMEVAQKEMKAAEKVFWKKDSANADNKLKKKKGITAEEALDEEALEALHAWLTRANTFVDLANRYIPKWGERSEYLMPRNEWIATMRSERAWGGEVNATRLERAELSNILAPSLSEMTVNNKGTKKYTFKDGTVHKRFADGTHRTNYPKEQKLLNPSFIEEEVPLVHPSFIVHAKRPSAESLVLDAESFSGHRPEGPAAVLVRPSPLGGKKSSYTFRTP